MQTYSIAGMKNNGQGLPNQKLMNSDEIQQISELNSMVPKMGGHAYKKSMVNPKQLRPPLEIQLPEHENDTLQSYASKIKQDSATHKTSAFLPNSMVSPTKEIKISISTAHPNKTKESPAQKDTIKNSFGGINLRSPKIPEFVAASSVTSS